MFFLALHIPDGFFPVSWCALGWLLTAPALLWSLRRWAVGEEDDTLAFAGLLAAFLFAAQTLQFPVGAGTTGHLVGSVLACVLLGPEGGFVVITSVLLMQALLFSVGGLFSLGWNLTNMGLLGGWTGYSLYRLFLRSGCPVRVAALAGCWLSIQFASVATCLELAAFKVSPLSLSLPAMLLSQGLVGLAEGAVTVAALGLLTRLRPGWSLQGRQACPGGWLALLMLLLAACSPPAVYGLSDAPGAWRYAALWCALTLVGLALPWIAWGRLAARRP